jgi:dipeptidyl aminopeptidase/acylaminoacyl peptidase
MRITTFLVFLCALALPARAADSPAKPLEPLTIEEATPKAVSWGLNLSPSGRYLAALRHEDKMDLIVVADLDNETAIPFVHPVPNGDVKWAGWASDDRLLFAAQFWLDGGGRIVPFDELKYRNASPVGRLFAIDRDGQNLVMLFAGNGPALRTINLTRVTDFLPNDPRHIVMPAWTSSFDLFKVDVYTGKSELIAEGTQGTRLWFTDRDGQPAFRLDVSWLGSLAYVYARKGPMPADPDDLEWEKIHTIRLRDEENRAAPDFYPLYPGPEPNSYYVAARPEGADTIGIYLYDFVAKQYLKTLASEPGVDIDIVLVDPDTRAYVGVEYYADRKVTRLVHPKLKAHFSALDKYFGGEVDLYVSDQAYDQSAWLLYTVGPRDRGSWHLYRLKDRDVREISHLFPVIDPKRLGTTRVLRYKARDGLEIMGYLTVPPAQPAGAKPPLIMLPHGGPEARDDYGFDPLVQLLVTRGYQVFRPNFRGSSGFGKRFLDAGAREWGGAMQNDLTDAFEYLVKSGHAERDRACIVGGSYGGYAALAAATMTPDLYRCAVSIAGVSDLLEQVYVWRRRLADDKETWANVKQRLGDPKADKAMLEARSPVRLATAVKVPVLLIHGEDDGVVPVEQSEMMDKALRKAGKDVRLVKLKDVGHSPDRDGWKLVYAPLLEFVEKHLPVTPPATTQPSP